MTPYTNYWGQFCFLDGVDPYFFIQMNIFKNIIDSWKKIPHSFKHYLAFLETEKRYIGYYKYKFHDVDKILMYLIIPWLGVERIKKIHRKFNRHHIQNEKPVWKCNYEEAAIDWECCRFTKANEPMSAREYLEYKKNTLRPVHYKHMDIVLNRFNL